MDPVKQGHRALGCSAVMVGIMFFVVTGVILAKLLVNVWTRGPTFAQVLLWLVLAIVIGLLARDTLRRWREGANERAFYKARAMRHKQLTKE